MASTPEKLLNEIVEIMERDLEEMRASSDDKLDVRSAAKITRYSKALLEILGHEAQQRKEAKRKLSELTKEELERKAREVLG